MKILAISDKVDDLIYNPNIRDTFSDIDVVLSCGDLPAYYLDFIVSNLNVSLYYVLGNHDVSIIDSDHRNTYFDTVEFGNKYSISAYQNFIFKHYKFAGENFNIPEGCENIDNKIVYYKNLLIGGLEGSFRYNNKSLQYTENEMTFKIIKMIPALYYNKLKYKRYIDILITHSPPFGIHDREDLCHRGFKSYLTFIRKYKPKYLLHGHTHIYDANAAKDVEYYGTKIINVYKYRIIEI